MIDRWGWVRYPAHGPYPVRVHRVRVLDFVPQNGYTNVENPNYDTTPEIKAVCINQDTGQYEEISLYYLYDKEPTK